MNYIRAIDSLRKGSPYTAMSEKYEDIIWQDEKTTIPTKEECEEELKRLEEEDKKTQYQRDRRVQYPAIEDQLDLLFHKGIDGWKEEIQKVKDKYPKPVVEAVVEELIVEEPIVEEPIEEPTEVPSE